MSESFQEKNKAQYNFNYIRSCLSLKVIEDDLHLSSLKELNCKEYINIPYCSEEVKEVLYQYKYLSRCKELFPTVFIPSFITTNIENSLINRIKLNRKKISFKVSEDNRLSIATYSFLPLIFQLQLMDFIRREYKGTIDSNVEVDTLSDFYCLFREHFKYNDVFNIEETPISKYLNIELGAMFSYGRLLDFADKSYDMYKHTEISVKSFRMIFYSFAQDLDYLGGDAYNLYMKSRNSNLSWQNAISQFLRSNYFLSEQLSKKISLFLIS